MFLCFEHEFLLAEGLLDSDNSGDESLVKKKKYFKGDFELSDSNCSDESCTSATTLPCSSSDPVLVDLTCSNNNPSKQIKMPIEQEPQTEDDAQFAKQLYKDFELEQNQLNLNEPAHDLELVDSKSVVNSISNNVDKVGELFIVIRRGIPVGRILSIWKREVRKNPSSLTKAVRVRILGEQGIDSGAIALEFFTETLRKIDSSLFPLGAPINSTLHVENGDFQACGQIVAASLAQGGQALKCLDDSVFNLMAEAQNLHPQQFDT